MKIGNVGLLIWLVLASTNRNVPVDRSFTEINNDTKSVDAMKVWL
jgi:hypothetical protein